MNDNNENADEVRTATQTENETTELPEEWRDLPTDPAPNRNLGYDLAEWEKINVVDTPDQVIFLPNSEEELHDDAFIVSETDAICDLAGRR